MKDLQEGKIGICEHGNLKTNCKTCTLEIRENDLENLEFKEYINKALEGEQETEIKEPMREGCKVAVMIPVYNEGYDDILNSAASLSSQEGIDVDSFEIDYIVNNDKKTAEAKNVAFQINQKAIALIKYMNGQSDKAPHDISDRQQRLIDQIRKSGVVVHVIDKSSCGYAEEFNTAGMAKDRVGAEICKRFITTPQGFDGIVAITDCDCTFSPNYIQALIDAFESQQIKGLLIGNLDFSLDPALPNTALTKKALEIFFEADGTFAKSNKNTGLEEKNGVYNKETFMRGANMAVKARTWALVGGHSKVPSGDDLAFGRKVYEQTGSLIKSYDYTVTTIFRASERVGSQGMGRIVASVNDSVTKFLEGEADKVLIEDMDKTRKFYGAIKEAHLAGKLTGAFILEQMKRNSFLKTDFEVTHYELLASKIGVEQTKEVDDLIFKLVYPYYPTRDITSEIVKEMRHLSSD